MTQVEHASLLIYVKVEVMCQKPTVAKQAGVFVFQSVLLSCSLHHKDSATGLGLTVNNVMFEYPGEPISPRIEF